MKSVCFYFQVHQPFRLRPYRVQDIGQNDQYFDEQKNEEIFRKVATKCYLPTGKLLLKLFQDHPELRLSFSLSGVFMDQCELYGRDVLEVFQDLVKTQQVEILAETHYHSLAALYSKKEFADQVLKHQKMVKKYFGRTPVIFRNTELIYNNEIAEFVRLMGFKGILAEGADHILGWRSPNYMYAARSCQLPREIQAIARKQNIWKQSGVKKKFQTTLPLFLKNYKLSDDIAFRFSNREWEEHPLSVEKFAHWIEQAPGDTINLFMDYETFGEHQWEDTGIFQFLEHLPHELKKRGIAFQTPSETIERLSPVAEIDMHHAVSWADSERDLSAWLGNDIQQAALETVYSFEGIMNTIRKKIPANSEQKIFDTWRRLQTSDQFYYMCTKYWADGDVHKYFSPFDSPYDAYIAFMNIVSDFENRLRRIGGA